MNVELLFEPSPDVTVVKGLLLFAEIDEPISLETESLLFLRDGNTKHNPYMLDVPGGMREPPQKDPTPFNTYQREVEEESGLAVLESNILAAEAYPGATDSSQTSIFLAARLDPMHKQHAKLGKEGLMLLIKPVGFHVQSPLAIPKQLVRIESCMEEIAA